MDIRFSKIARYVGNVGIGQHGYCFITNENGDIVYHPQQQLLYTGLKSEDTGWFSSLEDGVFHRGDQIYAIQTDENTGWRIVGVSYLDEVVNQQVQTAVRILTMLLAAVLFTAVVSSILLSRVVSRPIHGLVKAMQEMCIRDRVSIDKVLAKISQMLLNRDIRIIDRTKLFPGNAAGTKFLWVDIMFFKKSLLIKHIGSSCPVVIQPLV